MHRHEGVSERRLLELIHDHTHRIAERLELVFERQHTIFKEIRAMSVTIDTKFAEVDAALDTLSTGITAEIKQLADAIAAGGSSGNLTPAQVARFDGIRARMQTLVDALAGDDGTGGTGTGPSA